MRRTALAAIATILVLSVTATAVAVAPTLSVAAQDRRAQATFSAPSASDVTIYFASKPDRATDGQFFTENVETLDFLNDDEISSGGGSVSKSTLNGRTVLHVRGKSFQRTITVQRKLTAGQAATERLFEVRWSTGQNINREVGVGAVAKIPVRAYWFGPQALDRRAAIATEWSTLRSQAEQAQGVPDQSDIQAYTTLYETTDALGSSAIPGQDRPDGEIQVVSEARDSAHARFALAAFDGSNGDLRYEPWPRTSITLQNGEAATLIPDAAEGSGFNVLTDSTLISVVGQFESTEIPVLAAQLRPVGSR